MLNISPRLLTILLLATAASNSLAAEHPLFLSSEPLELVLDMPLKELLRHASKRPSVPGVLQYKDLDGRDTVLDVTISTRGNSRLEECTYPPLGINLKRQQVKSTLLPGRTSSSSLRYVVTAGAIDGT